MFSRGSGSSMANDKGKETMEEQDDNNGKPWLLPPPELLDEEAAPEWLLSLKGEEIIVEAEEEENNGSALLLQIEEAPEWLQVLMRAKFWAECRVHRVHRAEESVFCVHCFMIICPHCRHDEDEPTHRLLKIRRYVYRSVVCIKDMDSLGVDISYIQTYKCNGHNVVHLRPMRRSPKHRPSPETPCCMICDCWLHTSPSRLCSIACKHQIRREDAAAPDNLSPGPRGRSDAKGEVTSQHPNAQGQATPRRAGTGRRRRPRKQANPRRAPFF